MKIIYFSRTGIFAPAVAAGIHLNQLPVHPPSMPEEILSLPQFHPEYRADNSPVLAGQDCRGHDIYILGINFDRHLVTRLIESFAGMYDLPAASWRMVDLEHRKPALSLPLVLYRSLRLRKMEIHVIALHLLRVYPFLADQVVNLSRELDLQT